MSENHGGQKTWEGPRYFNPEAMLDKLRRADALVVSTHLLTPCPTSAFELFSLEEPGKRGVMFVGDPVKP